MLPIGVATTYKVPRRTLLSLSLMSVIVGAACQPLQPGDSEAPRPVASQDDSRTSGRDLRQSEVDEIWSLRPEPAPRPGSVPAPAGVLSGGQRIALIVPVTGRQQVLGLAVRDGFLAAHLDTIPGRQSTFIVIDEAAMGAFEAYQQASAFGAGLIVGPLLKESLQALAGIDSTLPVLALNSLGDQDPSRPGLWQFGLTPEDEAREVAARAIRLGQRRAITLTPDSEWGRRLLAAFANEFAALGGDLVASRSYNPADNDYSGPIRNLLQIPAGKLGQRRPGNPAEIPAFGTGRRNDMDFIFVAANSNSGRQLVPQLRFFGAGDVPTYSTSAIWEDGGADTADLNGVIFPDCPWVVAPDGRSTLIKSGLQQYWGRGALAASRLYALGHDAYQLVPVVLGQAYPGPFSAGDLQGATGILNADSSGRIFRRLAFAQIREGRPVALPAPGALFDTGPSIPITSPDQQF